MGYPNKNIQSIKINRVQTPGFKVALKDHPSTQKNKACAVLGGGPSLQDISPEKWKNIHTIGVNKAIMLPYVDSMYFMDFRLHDLCTYIQHTDEFDITRFRQAWNELPGIKYTIRTHKDSVYKKGVMALKRLQKPTLSLDIKNGIYATSNSGAGAIMLACALGFKTIYLFGYDLCVDRENNRTHWHKGYCQQTLGHTRKKLNDFLSDFEDIAKLVSKTDIKIYNTNPQSALQIFPKKTVDIL